MEIEQLEAAVRPVAGQRPTLACILAAGCGRRLGARGRERPKGFVAIDGRPIVERSILRLLDAGITRIVIVTGYHSHYYDALRNSYARIVTCVYNPHYADSGSMASLACARQLLTDDFLLLESDLVYEQRALDTVLDAPWPDVLLVSGPTGAGDEVYVESRDGWLVTMTKDRARLGAHVTDEQVGISRVSTALYLAMLGDLERSADPHLAYETTLAACARIQPVRCLRINDLLWAEIDDEAQFERAQFIQSEIVRRAMH